jgi:hypothetical protein
VVTYFSRRRQGEPWTKPRKTLGSSGTNVFNLTTVRPFRGPFTAVNKQKTNARPTVPTRPPTSWDSAKKNRLKRLGGHVSGMLMNGAPSCSEGGNHSHVRAGIPWEIRESQQIYLNRAMARKERHNKASRVGVKSQALGSTARPIWCQRAFARGLTTNLKKHGSVGLRVFEELICWSANLGIRGSGDPSTQLDRRLVDRLLQSDSPMEIAETRCGH